MKGLVFSVTILAVLLPGETTLAEPNYPNPVPIATFFPSASGIIFPPINVAAGINPAALPQKEPYSSLELTYSPAPVPGDSHNYFASTAIVGQEFGGGVGYSGGYGDKATHGAFGGVGLKTQMISAGLGLRLPDARKIVPQTDLGVLGSLKNDITWGFVLYHLESSPRLNVGIGFGREKNFKLELNLLIPPIGSIFLGDSEYIVTAANSVQLGLFALSFRSSYSTKTHRVEQSVSLGIWLGQNLCLAVQYVSPNRSTYGFLIKL